MNEARRRKVLKVMGVILLAFGGSLVYFLFFNSGLEILPDPSSQSGRVLIVNQSVHSIRGIMVAYVSQGEKYLIEVIPELKPGQEYPIPLSSQYVDEGKFVIHVSAPYHLSRQLALQAATANPLPTISFSFEFPSIATQNQSVSVGITACNEESTGLIVQASLELDDPSFGIAPSPKSWGIPPSECGSTQLAFTPLLPSETLSFKIKVFTPSLMLIERMFSIEVLSLTGNDQNGVVDQNGSVGDVNGMGSLDVNGLDVNAMDTNTMDTNTFADENGSVS